MDYFYQFLLNSLTSTILEISAGITGLYFLKKNPDTNNVNRYLVFFLWYTVFVEIFGLYAPLAYFTDYKILPFVKDTLFADNYWWYNIYVMISFSFFTYYFTSFFKQHKIVRLVILLIIVYLISSISYLIFTDIYFKGYSIFSNIIGTILILLSIIYYYFNLLRTDKILSLKKTLPVYISIGVLVFNLIGTPMDIFSEYFNSSNDIYVRLKSYILATINIILYASFIVGFIICSKDEN